METLRFLKTTFFLKAYTILYYCKPKSQISSVQKKKKGKKCEKTLESYLTKVLRVDVRKNRTTGGKP